MAFSELPITNRRMYFTGLLFSWVVLAFFLFATGKFKAFLWLHPNGPYMVDGFMQAITYLGDGMFCVLIALIFFYKRQWVSGTYIIIAYALSGLVTQVIKHLLNLPRPIAYFEAKGISIYTIPDLTIYTANSFPSGHTTSIFALLTCLVIIFRLKYTSLMLLAVAWIIAYSRVYLGQHFPEDVWAGSVIGVLFALLARWIIELLQRKFTWLHNTSRIPKS